MDMDVKVYGVDGMIAFENAHIASIWVYDLPCYCKKHNESDVEKCNLVPLNDNKVMTTKKVGKGGRLYGLPFSRTIFLRVTRDLEPGCILRLLTHPFEELPRNMER
jgi:hypothetical protein